MKREAMVEQGRVMAVCRNEEPGLPKPVVDKVHLIEGWGIEGDYHAGKFVRHRHLAKKDPTMPNLRQVLLIDGTLFQDLIKQDIQIGPGMMGENITVEDIDVMALEIGDRLRIGEEAILEVTEMRDPCSQLNSIAPGLLKAVVSKEKQARQAQAGMMTRILLGGWVQAGDKIQVEKKMENRASDQG